MNRDEFKKKLDSEGFSPSSYTLDGSDPANDGYVLKKEWEGRWSVNYVDMGRGTFKYLRDFDSEEEAFEGLFRNTGAGRLFQNCPAVPRKTESTR